MSSSATSTEAPLVYTLEEILADPEVNEPLVAGGVRCHGGFDADGRYRSPRTRFRAPAILAWQERLRREGADLVEVSPRLIPLQYPNVAQSKLLLKAGVREPVVRTLTIISIVEGFGAIIRDVEVPDLEACVVEPIEGTALAHLRGGLFEAHARDEAGHRDQGGHKQMWEAARARPGPREPEGAGRRADAPDGPALGQPHAQPRLPADRREARAHARHHGERAGDRDLRREHLRLGPGAALGSRGLGRSRGRRRHGLLHPQRRAPPRRVSADGALRGAGRALRTVDGGTIPGRTVVDGLLHRTLHTLTTERPRQQRDDLRESLASAMQIARQPGRLLEEFDALETAWTPPSATGFEAAAAG